jgi:acetyl esterase/lipase
MIHGGGFTIGGSHHVPVDQVRWFLERGIAVVSNEYRLLPQYVPLASRFSQEVLTDDWIW